MRPYLFTALFVLLCWPLRWVFPWHGYSFFLFLPAVALSSAWFGLGAGLFALALTSLAATFFFINPVYALWLSPQELPPLALYALTSIGIIGACEGLRLAARELSAAWRGRQDRRRTANGWAVTGSAATGLAATGAKAGARPRSGSVDMWRGFVLCTIFINHMPGNVFEALTFRNIGLSDSAEAFVFLSGVAMALAYRKKFESGRETDVSLSLLKRAVKLYGIHILMSLAGLAIFAAGAIIWRDPALMAMHGRDLYVKDAGTFVVGLVSLGHQLGYFNILPLYIVLIAFVPGLLYLARIRLELMLAASVLLYAATRFYGWNLPNWPIPGGWFFNPFAWQLMMAIGIAAGQMMQQHSLPRSKSLFVLSCVIVFVGAFVVTNGFDLSFGVRDAVYGWLDLDKTNLGIGRLVHFLGLAYFIYGLGVSGRLAASRLLQPLVVLGRNGLLVFVLLSLLAALGQVLLLSGHNGLGVQLALVVGGLCFFYAAARLSEAERAAGLIGRARPWGRRAGFLQAQPVLADSPGERALAPVSKASASPRR
ncbi:OpgC domain-containing protein [Labrys monachus]|uniref:Sensor protein KdpD transmembrane domain-containing protein n=1 Tax=Labrys monachus TaxID=217067 RepID=A0ABU0F973_9HYPH|nr:OpgC domain-containing protein [Labrys monachus]MDQ0391167.1 hypothetical protein [Labrys monachus]